MWTNRVPFPVVFNIYSTVSRWLRPEDEIEVRLTDFRQAKFLARSLFRLAEDYLLVREDRPVPLCWRTPSQRQQSGKRHTLGRHPSIASCRSVLVRISWIFLFCLLSSLSVSFVVIFAPLSLSLSSCALKHPFPTCGTLSDVPEMVLIIQSLLVQFNWLSWLLSFPFNMEWPGFFRMHFDSFAASAKQHYRMQWCRWD